MFEHFPFRGKLLFETTPRSSSHPKSFSIYMSLSSRCHLLLNYFRCFEIVFQQKSEILSPPLTTTLKRS